MARTPNFGLSAFGAGENITANAYKHTNRDRYTLDALLWTLFNHDHSTFEVGDPITPPAVPYAEVQLGEGAMPAGSGFTYMVTFIDEFGNETAPSSPVPVHTPNPVAAPPAPGLTASPSDGTLASGLYYYAVGFGQTGGGATRAPNTSSVTVTGPTGSVDVALPTALPGADTYMIYRQAPGEASLFLLDEVAVAAQPQTYTDDGSISDCHIVRPQTNTTNANNSIEITLAETVLDERIRGWKIYRIPFGAPPTGHNLLVTLHDEDEEAELVTSYEDVGGPTTIGYPPEEGALIHQVGGLDLATALDSSSGRLPASFAPLGTGTFSTLMAGELVHEKVYNQFVPQADMNVSRVEAFFQTAPDLDGGSVTITLQDDFQRNEVQHIVVQAQPQDEVQKVWLSEGINDGFFTLTFDGQTTDPLPWDIDAPSLGIALNQLSNITQVYVSGMGWGSNPWLVTFLDPGGQSVAQMTADDSELNGTITVETWYEGSDGGTYKLIYDGEDTTALAFDADATDIKTALESLTAITSVTVTGAGSVADPFVVTFLDPGYQNVMLIGADASDLSGNIYVVEAERGAGNTVIQVTASTNDQYQVWQSPDPDPEFFEAEDGTGGAPTPDTLASSGEAMALDYGGADTVVWEKGVLDAGEYDVEVRVRSDNPLALATFRVLDNETPVAEVTYAAGMAYNPPIILNFQSTGVEDFNFEVEIVSDIVDVLMVDRFRLVPRPPVLHEGSEVTVDVEITGTPVTPGSDVQVNVWY